MSIKHIISLLEAILPLAYFQWLGVYYAQTEGCTMGDSTSTPLSNTFMTAYETDVLTTYRSCHDPPANLPAAAAPMAWAPRRLSNLQPFRASSSSGSARRTTP
jgi:hypothetical protein